MKLENLANINYKKYCRYYQAHVIREQAWFFVAIVRSYEHMMFDRTFDTKTSVFEFFVPIDMEGHFLALMTILIDQGIIEDLQLYENRLTDPSQIV